MKILHIFSSTDSRKVALLSLIVGCIYVVWFLGIFIYLHRSHDNSSESLQDQSNTPLFNLIINVTKSSLFNMFKREFNCTKQSAITLKTSGVEDLLCMHPPSFIEHLKTPCWFSETDKSDLRCLPYFMLIGVSKCGTTDFYNRLNKHPFVLNNAGFVNKEVDWWCRHRYELRMNDLNWYAKYFQKGANTIAVSSNSSKFIIGDGSIETFAHFFRWKDIPQNQGLSLPIVLTPHLIRHVIPNVKLIVMLRDPTEMIYSRYLYFERPIKTPNGFHGEVSKSLEKFDMCKSHNSLKSCLFNWSVVNTMLLKLHLGFYYEYMKEWLNVFPREQVLIIRTEDYVQDIAGHLSETFRFLDLPPLSGKDIQSISALKVSNKNKNREKIGRMLNETRILLDNLYRSSVQSLANMLKDDRFRWNK